VASSLELDALWQLLGFFLGWAGRLRQGPCTRARPVKLAGKLLPTVRKVVYGIDVKRIMRSKLMLGVADVGSRRTVR
jgi:3-hydroxyacyl-[acyl-carrier protein] dehydratase / trans-2-decenoyl-[acyl-carrier protein] isomerase